MISFYGEMILKASNRSGHNNENKIKLLSLILIDFFFFHLGQTGWSFIYNIYINMRDTS